MTTIDHHQVGGTHACCGACAGHAPSDVALPVQQPRGYSRIHKPYFLAALLVVLTVGASWGAWLLWQIGLNGSFTAASIFQVNAHGHAQIYGFVGLFIMGFAYQAFPRMSGRTLLARRLALAVLVAMLIGVLVHAIGLIRTPADALSIQLVLWSGVLQCVAVGVFVVQIMATTRRAGPWDDPSHLLINAALVWFFLSTIASAAHSWNLVTAESQQAVLWQVKTYQAALRDMQIHGMAMLMILGVGARVIPGMFGLRGASIGLGRTVFVLLNIAISMEIVSLVSFQVTGQRWWTVPLYAAWILLAVGALALPIAWRVWGPVDRPNRSTKFLRAAFTWLAVSLAMMLLLPAYAAISGEPFSHAYYGSVRHAITVGFITMMIMAVSSRVIPNLYRVPETELSALWGPFLLINVGCLLRVSLQTLTDWNDVFFGLVGVSSLLEVTAIAWWGAALATIMLGWRRPTAEGGARDASRSMETA